MRLKFDGQLALMKNELIQMGAICEEAISLAAKALGDGDKSLSEKAVSMDTELGQMERIGILAENARGTDHEGYIIL